MELLPVPPKLPPRDTALSDRQRHFCDHYLMQPDEDKAKAAAGYAANARPLQSAKVTNEIRQRQAERSHNTDIDSRYLLLRLVAELEADLADLYDPKSGDILPIHQWPLIWRQGLVTSLDTTESGNLLTQTTKIKLSDRTKRLELIGKHVDVNAFKEQISIEQTINVNVTSVELLTQYLERVHVTIEQPDAE